VDSSFSWAKEEGTPCHVVVVAIPGDKILVVHCLNCTVAPVNLLWKGRKMFLFRILVSKIDDCAIALTLRCHLLPSETWVQYQGVHLCGICDRQQNVEEGLF
jgi:hypothetical protein